MTQYHVIFLLAESYGFLVIAKAIHVYLLVKLGGVGSRSPASCLVKPIGVLLRQRNHSVIETGLRKSSSHTKPSSVGGRNPLCPLVKLSQPPLPRTQLVTSSSTYSSPGSTSYSGFPGPVQRGHALQTHSLRMAASKPTTHRFLAITKQSLLVSSKATVAAVHGIAGLKLRGSIQRLCCSSCVRDRGLGVGYYAEGLASRAELRPVRN